MYRRSRGQYGCMSWYGLDFPDDSGSHLAEHTQPYASGPRDSNTSWIGTNWISWIPQGVSQHSTPSHVQEVQGTVWLYVLVWPGLLR